MRQVSDSLATQITAWSTFVITVVGIITLIASWVSSGQRRRATHLQIGRRAYRIRRTMREWLNDPALSAQDNLTVWVEKVAEGLGVVEKLLEEIVEMASGASGRVQEAARDAYGVFMRGATFINKFGQHPHPSGHTNPRDQALAAKTEFETAVQRISVAVPDDLNRIGD